MNDLIKIIGIFLLTLLVMIIINVGIVLLCIFIPILAWIIFGMALAGLFFMIYKMYKEQK